MAKNPMLDELLFNMRQHPAFPDLLKFLPEPRNPQFRKGMTVEEFGGLAIHSAGETKRHRAWIALLTGNAATLEEQND